MLKRAFFFSLGVLLVGLGLVGLLIPILPGFLFLILAVVCFPWPSPRLQQRLEGHPGWHRGRRALGRFRRRWQASSGLPALSRVRLAFWLGAEAALKVASPRR